MSAELSASRRLGTRAATGVRWTLLEQLGQQLARLVIMVLLARLLLPKEFGLAALAFVVTDVSRVFGDVGLAPALVYVHDVQERHLRTSFTFGGLIGLAATCVVAASATVVADFFRTPEVRPLLLVMSLTFVLKGLVGTLHNLWRRHMQFDLFAKSTVVSVVAAGSAAVVTALNGGGAWALVVYALGESALGLLMALGLTVRAGLWRPRWGLDRAALRELSAFGGTVSTSRLLLYGRQNVDNLIVGRVLGSTALGLYGFAYRAMLYPVQRLSDVLSGVAYPAFCRMRDDHERLGRAFLLSLRTSCVAVLPVSVGCAVTAPVLVPVVFGPEWEPAVATVQILALNGVRAALGTIDGTVMEATGRPRWNLWLSIALIVLLVPALLLGVQHGIVGVAVAYTVTGLVLLPPAMAMAARCARLSWAALYAGLRWILLATVALAAAAEVTLRSTAEALPAPLQLIAAVLAGASAFVGVLWFTDRAALTEPAQRLSNRSGSP